MTRLGMVIDISKCTACYCCFAACKDEYWENDYPPFTTAQPKHGQSWMNVEKKERGKFPYVKAASMPVPCMHCEDAPCIKAAKNNAVYKMPNGIVVIDPRKAKGQVQLLDKKACPYGVIFWNEATELPQKCTFCAHRVAEGKIPRCVQACPSECIKFGDLENSESEVSKSLKIHHAEVFLPELKTKPKVYYVDLHKMTRNFVAGAVVLGDTDECAEGVAIQIKDPDRGPITVRTNAFGNFEIDGLKSGKYSMKLEKSGYTTKTLNVEIKNKSEYLGDIVLLKSFSKHKR